MPHGSILLKTLAVTFSLSLAGGYVWFRSGGSIPYLAPAKQARTNPDRTTLTGSKSAAAPVEFPETPRDPNDVVVPPEILEQADRDRTFFSGSKSDRVDISSLPAIEALIVEPDSNPVTKYSQYRTPDSLMFSSKSGAIHFDYGPQPEPKSEPKPQPEPVINNPKPASPDAQTTVQRQRTFLPGSKSFDARESGTVYKPQPVEESPKPEPAQQRRTILPGSKSMKIEAPPPASSAPEEKKPRTILPGPKSFAVTLPTDTERPIKLLRPRLDPNEKSEHFDKVIVKEETPVQQVPKQPRTLLPGSKSALQPLESQTPAAAPADSNRHSSIVNRQSAQPQAQSQAPAQPQQQTDSKRRVFLPGSKASALSSEREN